MKTKTSVVIHLLLMIGAGMQLARGDQPATRAQFAAAISKVAKGTPADGVIGLLGKPDDVITQSDPNGNDDDPTAEVWCYGTDGHLTFPTLGKVFMAREKVQYLFGGTGTPPDASMFAEPELRKLLRTIDAFTWKNPLPLIRAVNALQLLGKEKALAALAEYRRVGQPPPSGSPVLCILRVLFEGGDPADVSDLFGDHLELSMPADTKRVLLFPFAVVNDIPLRLKYGTPVGNMMLPPNPIEYFRKNGTLRQHPLVPGNDPLSVLPALEKSPQWIYPAGNDKEGYPIDGGAKYSLEDQLLYLVDTVYRVERDRDGYVVRGKRTPDQYWDEPMKAVAALHIHWDAEKEMYVFPDGHTLPDNSSPIYKRQIWELPFAKVPTRLIFARSGKDYITISFVFPREVYNPVPDSFVTVRTRGKGARQLLQFKIGYSKKRGEIVTHFWNREITLAGGESVQGEITTGDKTVKSAVFTP